MFDNEASNRDNDAVLDAQDAEEREATVYVVAKYSTRRVYGGPEEGGWWWTQAAFDKVVTAHVYEFQASRAVSSLNQQANTDPDGGFDYRIIELPWTDEDGEFRLDIPAVLPKHRPYYS